MTHKYEEIKVLAEGLAQVINRLAVAFERIASAQEMQAEMLAIATEATYPGAFEDEGDGGDDGGSGYSDRFRLS